MAEERSGALDLPHRVRSTFSSPSGTPTRRRHARNAEEFTDGERRGACLLPLRGVLVNMFDRPAPHTIINTTARARRGPPSRGQQAASCHAVTLTAQRAGPQPLPGRRPSSA